MDYTEDATTLVARQIWVNPTTASNSLPPTCTPFVLSSGGLINVGRNTVITLTQDAAFQPLCPGTPVPAPLDPTQPGVESVLNFQDPFYSSTNPQIYAIAAVTVVSYMLVIILFITPRTFLVGGMGGGRSFLGQGGMVSGTYGSNSIIGVGSRPWLQKAATVAVAIALTIVTADTLKRAEIQYNEGYADAKELTIEVNDGLEIRILRVISETFLWLAQAQTLIRLFPRHKEKLVIKWTAFGLITLELVFSSLDHFVDEDGRSYPRNFVSAIPALDYLFALALNLCYAAFVIYYSAVKRRFAFWNRRMRNMPLVALLSLTAVLIPVIFFILDLSQPDVSGWGNYVRWVGAAAASVIVWEWVERIEALERDEKKDGILGREIFDGDEMLENTPSSDGILTRLRDEKPRGRGNGGSGGFGDTMTTGWNTIAARTRQLRQSHGVQERPHGEPSEPETSSSPSTDRLDLQRKADTQSSTPRPPPSVATPSRAGFPTTKSRTSPATINSHSPGTELASETLVEVRQNHPRIVETPTDPARSAFNNGLSRLLNPFKRQKTSPPLEVAQAMSSHSRETTIAPAPAPQSLWQKLHLKKTPKEDKPPRPVIVIPAPQRRRPFPTSEDEEDEEGAEGEGSDNINDESENLETRSNSHAGTAEVDSDQPSPPPARDSPPDAILRAINSSPPHSPHNYHRGSDQVTGIGNASHRPSSNITTCADMQVSRRGTLLISESRKPGDLPNVSSPSTPRDSTRGSPSAVADSGQGETRREVDGGD